MWNTEGGGAFETVLDDMVDGVFVGVEAGVVLGEPFDGERGIVRGAGFGGRLVHTPVADMDDVLRAGGGASHRPERPDAARGHRGHLRVGEHRLLGGFPGLLDGGVIRINVMLEAFPFTEPVGDVEGRGIRGVAGGHCAFLSWVDAVAKLVEALGLGLLASGLLACEPLFPDRRRQD